MSVMIRGRPGVISWIFIIVALISYTFPTCQAEEEERPKPPKAAKMCGGIFVTYNSEGRERIFPFVKNVSAQAWKFKATATVFNMGREEIKGWQLFVKFQYRELLVKIEGGSVIDGEGLPVQVEKTGTILAGSPQTDLKTAIDTASDYTQMVAQIKLTGTQFGGGRKVAGLPRMIRLANPEFKCTAPVRKGRTMQACCKKDPKYRKKKQKIQRRQFGDLDFTYDVMKADANKYLAQVTINNNHPLGRLDQWNLTWTWMKDEFIYSMKGAYTHEKGPASCISGPQGKYYKDFDFSGVYSCQKEPLISDLPSEMENDDKVGRLPYCCKNGILLPNTINETMARALFQMEVFKLPPDVERLQITPPQNWRIVGRVNPTYKCGPPVLVEPTVFPDPMGLDATVSAIASWQITCNMSRPKPKKNKCCVSYSAYYADAAIPCNTCACGCEDEDTDTCNDNAAPLLLPADALLLPFANRTKKAKAFALMHDLRLPQQLPCPDNCGVSVNWHIDSDHKNGWTVRITIFNWEKDPFSNWYAAIKFKNDYKGLVRMHSFNATKLTDLDNTIMFRGLPGDNYLVGESKGARPGKDPPVPGKQQTSITFSKAETPNINVVKGDGFPAKFYFNGDECALPTRLPSRNIAARGSSPLGLLPAVVLALLTYLLLRTN